MANKFGKFFPNHLEKRSGGTREINTSNFMFSEMIYEEHEHFLPRLRFSLLCLIVIGLFFLIIGRLISLQIFDGEKWRKLSEGNRIFTRRIIASRGIITDRFGKSLVINEPKFLLRDNNKVQVIKEEQALEMEAQESEDYKKLEIVGVRRYLYPAEFSHVIGYLGEINKDELKSDEFKGYQIKDQVGRSGVEQYYESVLKGKNGEEYYEVTSDGRIVNKMGEVKSIPGENIKLTIDADLQRQAYQALQKVVNDVRYAGGKQIKGAVIVTAVPSGEVLAMVSLPVYDTANITTALKNTTDFPFMNRVISATYPPGSTFKIVIATAGLESGRITKNTLIEDMGVIKIGQWEFPTWSSVRDGMMDIVKGIKRSNDIFFYKAGEKIGLSRIREYALQFGVGSKLGIDLPAEATGNLPSDEWKMEVAKEHWYLGDTYHLSIGQGYILTTPLQVNMWTNTIASRGKLYRPHVVINSKLPASPVGGKAQNDYLIRDLHFKKETLDLIWKGMKEACQTGGTGWPMFDFKIPVACKTGTSEFGDPSNKTHAWFTVFAPADKPEIAVTVLIEGGGQGSDVAAPVARKVLEKYFEGK
jgi:penicillin-binding protein 2